MVASAAIFFGQILSQLSLLDVSSMLAQSIIAIDDYADPYEAEA